MMSYDAFLNQTCTIKRPTSSGVDRYNANTYTETTVGVDIPCRLVEKSVKLMEAKTSEYSWVKANVLLLPSNVVVLAKDEVTLNSVKYAVRQVLNRERANVKHHVSCVVEALNV